MLVEFKLGREMFAHLFVGCYEDVKKKWKEKKCEKKRKRKKKEKSFEKEKKSSNNCTNKYGVLVWKFGNVEEVWLNFGVWNFGELITPLGLGKFLFQLPLEIAPCLLARPHYNLEKPLWFLLLYVQYEFLDECII